MDQNRHFQKNTSKKNENERNNFNMRPAGNRIGLLVLFLLGAFFIVMAMMNKETNVYPVISYSDFLTAVGQHQVSDVQIQDQKIILGTMRSANISDGAQSRFQTVIPYNDTSLMSFLEQNGVQVSGKATKPNVLAEVLDFLPLFIMLIFLFVFMRQMSMQNSRGMQFGRSRARLFDTNKKKVTFADVAGQEEAKKELSEIVDFLKNPKKYREIGAKIPGGVLLVGSPGTGKTLLARAVAGEANVSFLHISGSDFVEMFVGVGASRVRDLFEQGRKRAPAIIFIDELDAVGRARGAGFGGGHDEREQTLNQMLVEMDGFDGKEGVIVLAATNRPDVLDPALLRPGRFDRQVHVSLPDIKEREAILIVHAKKIKLDDDVDFKHFARATSGMSGADLSNMINEGALFAARKNKEKVSFTELEQARDKILMGVARESMVMPEKERVMTACHEAGHALPYYYLKNASPLHKVTIIPRGRALGLTVGLPKEDSYSHTKSWLEDQLVILFGGYAAESIVYGDTTTGTQNDIERATDIARRMVCEWGMSEDVGAVSYGREDEPIFMGKEIERRKGYSEESAQKIDRAVEKLLNEARKRTLKILTEHRDQLDKLTQALVEKETLDDKEVRELLGFKPSEALAENEAEKSAGLEGPHVDLRRRT
ncbi:ATP-dependent metallopeptidase HflB [Treponema maltophilum ATCC 51939]|uniref:ATP-dependent zinc metalloprotease FtsH n=1 Tax=Treponema maltophilum ATCC 51939 TaxID=1125699 RepID=S3KFP1_TREMA|nr:ATP-dependent zinc metalloprotease FtsH [Treponema maltophilum]EPF31042.1 ATP-dependent metallopeptidase HflB [Treponema maltophilum ATCC 51939]